MTTPGDLDPALDAALLSRIEDAGLNASAPPQQRWLDGWLVRFSPGKAKRARCVNAVAEGRLGVAERLAACEAVFERAALPAIYRITPFTRPADLDRILEARGLRRFDDTRVMALADLSRLAPPSLGALTLHRLDHAAFAELVGGFRGSEPSQRTAHAERLLNSPVPYTGFELRDAGVPVACGEFALEGDLVGLYDVYTVEFARGRGLAGLLCQRLLAAASARGARHAYLQVEGDNLAARAVYLRLGFVDCYAYHYRTLHPSAA